MTIHCQPTPSTTFHQYTSAYPFSDVLQNYPSSMRFLTKQRLLTHHTNNIYCVLSTYTSTTCFLTTFINSVSNNYYSLDYISPCLSPNHFKQLQRGFQLIHNTQFCEHILSEYQPGNTSCPNLKSKLSTKTNNDFDFHQYSSYLGSIRPIN